MKIALISSSFFSLPPPSYGGLEIVVTDLAETLAKLGHDVTVFATEGSKVEGCEIVEIGPVKNANVNAFEAERDSYEIYKDKLEPFDIIHGHNWFGFEYACKAQNPNLKVCHTHHGALYLVWWRKSTPPFKLNLIAISQWMQKVYHSVGFDAKYVYNGVNLKRYPYKKTKGNRLLYVGRFDQVKQAHVAIEIAKKLDLGLDLVGGTFVRNPSYFQLIKSLCDGKQFILYPNAPHEVKLDLMQNAKCFLFPSKMGEPFGLVAVEAMACGTPVVALNDGAISEVVKEGGFVCNDVEAMIDMVKQVDTIKPRDCRKNAQFFSRENMAKNYLRLYKQLYA